MPNSHMAFIAVPFRTVPTAMGRRGGSSNRRGSSQRSRTNKQRTNAPRLDPLLDDQDIDTTDITTYISCPTCFNSLMLRPEKLARGPLRVKCNCCEKRTNVAIDNLENVDGTLFDVEGWLRTFRAKGRLGEIGESVDGADADMVHLEFEDDLLDGEDT